MKSKREVYENAPNRKEWNGGLKQLIGTCHNWPVILRVSNGLSNLRSPSSNSSSSLSLEDKEYWRQRKLMESGSMFMAISIETKEMVQFISENDNYVSMSIDFPLTLSLSGGSGETVSFQNLHETGWCESEKVVKKIYPRQLLKRPKYAWLPDGFDMGNHDDSSFLNIYQGSHQSFSYTSSIFSKALYFVKTFQESFLLCVSLGAMPDFQPSASQLFFIPAYYPLQLVTCENDYEEFGSMIEELGSLTRNHNCPNPFALEISMSPCDKYEPIELIKEESSKEIIKEDYEIDSEELQNKMHSCHLESERQNLTTNSNKSFPKKQILLTSSSSLINSDMTDVSSTSPPFTPVIHPRTPTKKRPSVVRREAFANSKDENGKRRSEIRNSIGNNVAKSKEHRLNVGVNNEKEIINNTTLEEQNNQTNFIKSEESSLYSPGYQVELKTFDTKITSVPISKQSNQHSQSTSNLPANIFLKDIQPISISRKLSVDNSAQRTKNISSSHSSSFFQPLSSDIRLLSASNSWEILEQNPPEPIQLATSTSFPIQAMHPKNDRSRPLPPIPRQKKLPKKIEEEKKNSKNDETDKNPSNETNQSGPKNIKKKYFSQMQEYFADDKKSFNVHIIDVDEKKNENKINVEVNRKNDGTNFKPKGFSISLKSRKAKHSMEVEMKSRDDMDSYMKNKNDRVSTSTLYRMKKNENSVKNQPHDIMQRNEDMNKEEKDNENNTNTLNKKFKNNKIVLSKQISGRSHYIASSLNSLPKKLKFWRLSSKNEASKDVLKSNELSQSSSLQADSFDENDISDFTTTLNNNDNCNDNSVFTYDEATRITSITKNKNKKKNRLNNNNNNIIHSNDTNSGNFKSCHSNDNIQEVYDVLGGNQGTNSRDVRKLSKSLDALSDVVKDGDDDGDINDDSFYDSINDDPSSTDNHQDSQVDDSCSHSGQITSSSFPDVKNVTSNQNNLVEIKLVSRNGKNKDNNLICENIEGKNIIEKRFGIDDNSNNIDSREYDTSTHPNELYLDMNSSNYLLFNNHIKNDEQKESNNEKNKFKDYNDNAKNSNYFMQCHITNDNDKVDEAALFSNKIHHDVQDKDKVNINDNINNNNKDNNNFNENNDNINNDETNKRQTYLTPECSKRWQNIGEIAGNVNDFNVEEVGECLELLGMGGYGKKFRKEQMDGSLLSSLDVEVLMQDFGFKKFDAIKLLKFCKEGWRPKIHKMSPL